MSCAEGPSRADHAASLIDSCRSPRRLRQIHAAVLRAGLHDHRIILFKLQRRYSSFRLLPQAQSLFHLTPNPSVFSWTSLIHAHASLNLNSQTLLLFSAMVSSGVQPNTFTFSASLSSCDLSAGKALHSQAIRLGLAADSYVATALIGVYARSGDVFSARYVFDELPDINIVSSTAMIDCYAKAGDLEMAREVFQRTSEPDVVCWNAMIGGYAQQGKPGESLKLFRQMLKSSKAMPDEATLLAVLSSCSQLGAMDSGRWVHSYAEAGAMPITPPLGTALVDMYSKCGSLEDARKVFDEMLEKDVVTWNAMIGGYAVHGRSREALSLFSDMLAAGIRPTDITVIGVLSACSHAGMVSEGRRIFNSMEKFDLEPKIEHFGCMVDLLGRAGRVEEAYELAKSMPMKTDAIIWSSILSACKIHGHVELGKHIAESLIRAGEAKSGTYVIFSKILADGGESEAAAEVMRLMKDGGVRKETSGAAIEVNGAIHEFCRMEGD